MLSLTRGVFENEGISLKFGTCCLIVELIMRFVDGPSIYLTIKSSSKSSISVCYMVRRTVHMPSVAQSPFTKTGSPPRKHFCQSVSFANTPLGRMIKHRSIILGVRKVPL